MWKDFLLKILYGADGAQKWNGVELSDHLGIVKNQDTRKTQEQMKDSLEEEAKMDHSSQVLSRQSHRTKFVRC